MCSEVGSNAPPSPSPDPNPNSTLHPRLVFIEPVLGSVSASHPVSCQNPVPRVNVRVRVKVRIRVRRRLARRVKLRLEGGGVGSGMTTLHKKACEGLVWLYALHPCQKQSRSS